MRHVRLSIVLFTIAIVSAFQPNAAWGADLGNPILILPYNPAQPNYSPSHKISLACYEYDEDNDVWIYINCTWEVTLTESSRPLIPTDDPGPRHDHNGGGKPLGKIRVVDTGIEYDNLVIDIDSKTMINYLSPEVAGAVLLEGTATFPDERICLYPLDCKQTLEFYVRYHVRSVVSGENYKIQLIMMPLSASFFTRTA